MRYFLDTYAIIEIIKGNFNYGKYLNEELFTSIFNLYELYFTSLRDYGESDAKKFFFQFNSNVIPIKKEYIFLASEFKLKNKKVDISYTDAIGYAIAKLNNMKFLTGDKEFENLENVEFIK